LDFPKQFRAGIEAAKEANFIRKISAENIIICAMGGSALPGNILKAVNKSLKLTKLPIFIHRDYGLPGETSKKSLVVCISYSGNTEETLSAFKEAKKRKIKIVVIASGGKLIDIAKKNKIPFIKVPSGIQPRCALGYQFSALAKTLSRMGLIKNIAKELLILEKDLQPKKIETKGRNIANDLTKSIPLVYSSEDFSFLAKIWKIKFNENSKVPSFFNFFPELNHNEIVGMAETRIREAKRLFKVIILRDKNGDKRILKRVKVTSEILKNKGIKIIFVNIQGKGFLEKIFSNILLGDWISYYLALSQKINPGPVKTVEDFKRRLAK